MNRACRMTVRACSWLAGYPGTWIIVLALSLSLPMSAQSPWTGGPTGPIYYNGGNVGIGTMSPQGDIDITASFPYMQMTATSNTQGAGMGFYENSTELSGFYTYGSAWYDVNRRGDFEINSRNGDILLNPTNGNVGIGTTSPQTLGHIVKPYTNDGSGGTTGSDVIWGTWGVYKSDMTLLLDTGGIRTANRGGGIGFSNADGFVLGAIKGAATNSNGSEYGGYLGFYTTGANSGGTVASGYERMRIDQDGNVGIGTTSPQYKLAVNGTIGAKEVIVTNTGWPDYVFKPGYRLKPLAEISAYIGKHHHLPDIPSESEVKAKGVSVGEMQAKLLAKIEELTLHMIAADERNSRLEGQNRELQERVSRLESRR